MKKSHGRITSIGILLVLVFSLLATPAAAAEISLDQLDGLNQQIASITGQLTPLQDEVDRKTINLVPLIYAEVIQTTPQYIVKGGALSLAALVGAGTPYYIIQNPQDGNVNILGAYSGRHAPVGKVQVQVDGLYETATVLGPVPTEIFDLEERLGALKAQRDQLVKQRDELEDALENQFAAQLKNHLPLTTEGLLFQIENPKMLVKGVDRMIEWGNLRASPTVNNGNTMVPIRALVEGLRGTVEWNQASQSAVCKLNGKTVILSVGSDTAIVDDTPVKITSPVVVQNGKTMVPLRFVSEHLGATVEWMGADQTIHVILPSEPVPEVIQPIPEVVEDEYIDRSDYKLGISYSIPSTFEARYDSPLWGAPTGIIFEYQGAGGYSIYRITDLEEETFTEFAREKQLVQLTSKVAEQYDLPIEPSGAYTIYIDPKNAGTNLPAIYCSDGESSYIMKPYINEECSKEQQEKILTEFFRTVKSLQFDLGQESPSLA